MRTLKPLRYHLRFQVIPGPCVAADARALVRFCKAHGVEEVALFLAAEEWNNGLLSRKEEDQWFQTVRQVKTILDRAGLVVSLNPWMTTLHCSRGRRFPKDRRFEPMVSPLGETSRACASFADPRWRDYVFHLYGRFAELGFRVMWVEDDFRYHNHAPLTWGGGFEGSVLRRFSKMIGRPVTREAVVHNLLKPGTPHPWRAKWLENWREIQLDVAEGLARAVDESSGGRTRLGLMSSHPSVHSAEGRDWKKLFRALSVGGQVAHRPHFAGYGEAVGVDKAYSTMMLDIQKNFRPSGCEVAPEVENFPFTRWTKSDALTWAEMALALFHGSDALLLDLFPFSGNPANTEPQIGELLDRSRPSLEWIAARFGHDLQTAGVGMPWREDAAVRVPTAHGRALEELYVWPFEAGNFLLSYGIPVAARRQTAPSRPPVNAIFGSMAWTLEETEIFEMLCGGILLDGAAAHILCQRGFGPQIGVAVRRMVGREDAPYSLERIASRESGLSNGMYFNHNTHLTVAEMSPLKGAREWTTLLTPDRKRFGAATVAYENNLGGRVFTFAAPNPAALPRSYQKQVLVQRAVDFLARGRRSFATVTGGPHLLPIQLQNHRQHFVVVFNGSPDPARPTIHLDATSIRPLRGTVLHPLEKPHAARLRSVSVKSRAVQLEGTIPHLGFLVIES